MSSDAPLEFPKFAQSLDFQILELSNVEDLGNNNYRSLSNDPSFYLVVENPFLFDDKPPFHLFFHCLIASGSDYIKSEIFLPLADGTYSPDSVISKYNTNISQTFIISSAYLGKKLRFDPVDTHEEFQIKFMKFYLWSQQASHGFLSSNDFMSFNSKILGQGDNSISSLNSPVISFHEAYSKYSSGNSNVDPYSLWISVFEHNHFLGISKYNINSERCKFSILLVVCDAQPEHLRACVKSVLAQEYANWELCIVDSNSSREETLSELKSIEELDGRIYVKHSHVNGQLVSSLNEALEMSSGDKVCLLNQGDILSSKALLYFAIELEANPNLKFIYTDEDSLNHDGERTNPHFKSDWNRTMLYSFNYVGHFVCCDSNILKAINGFRAGSDGAQEFDLLLRLTDLLADYEIHHIPYILYHSRVSQAPSFVVSDSKSDIYSPGLNSLISSFQKSQNPPQIFHGSFNNVFSLRWPIEHSNPLVSIIIPTRDNLNCLQTCIASLSKTTYANYEIIILNNGSVNPSTLQYLETISTRNHYVTVVNYDVPFNFSRINNYAVNFAKGSVLCFLNDDTEIIKGDWLEIMLGHALRDNVGCVGAKLLYSDDTLQHAGIITSIGGLAGHSHKHLPNCSDGYFMRPHLDQEMSAVTGACLMVQKDIFIKLNGFDQNLFPVAFNDVDFCLKALTSGFKNIYASEAVLYHHESKTRGYEDTPEKKQRFNKESITFQKVWKYYSSADRYYSPHLTRAAEDFSIRI